MLSHPINDLRKPIDAKRNSIDDTIAENVNVNVNAVPIAFGADMNNAIQVTPAPPAHATFGDANGRVNVFDDAPQATYIDTQHVSLPMLQPVMIPNSQPPTYFQPSTGQSMINYQNPLTTTAVATAPAHTNAEMQSLVQRLNEERQRNVELQNTVAQQQTVIESLQVNLKQTVQRDTKESIELHQLQAELASHAKTISILVGERAEQQARIAQLQQDATSTTSVVEELQGRLNASRHRVNELERGVSSHESSQKKFDQSRQSLCTELENAQEQIKALQRTQQDAVDETTNMQHQLAVKVKEVDALSADLAQKTSEVDLLKVRVEQLSSGDVNLAAAADGQFNSDEKFALEKQITELHNTVSVLSGEGERIEQQYQTYVQHLTKENTLLIGRVDELVEAKETLVKREESLLNHTQELERQIQKQINTQKKLDQQQRNDEDVNAKVTDGSQQADLFVRLTQLEKINKDYEVRRRSFSRHPQLLDSTFDN